MSLSLAIEVSPSMTPGLLNQAREAALEAIDALPLGSEAAVIAFGGQARVIAPLSGDLDVARAAIRNLETEFASAMYDGVAQAADALGPATGDRHLVLITYGWDFGRVSTTGRRASIEAVRESGARAYSFALGVDFDAEYLRQVEGTAGAVRRFEPGALAAALGQAETATVSLLVSIPVLTVGEHTLRLTDGAGGAALAPARIFAVSNEGLLSFAVSGDGTGGEAMTVEVDFGAPLDGLDLEALIGEQALPSTGADAFSLDPWLFEPGEATIRLRATRDGELVASVQEEVTIPALEPLLRVERTTGDDGPGITVAARVQGTGSANLVVVPDEGDEVRSSEPLVRVPLARSAGATVWLENAEGTSLLLERVDAVADAAPAEVSPTEPAGERFFEWAAGDGLPVVLGLPALLALAGLAIWVAWQSPTMLRPQRANGGVPGERPAPPPVSVHRPAPAPVAAVDEPRVTVPTDSALPTRAVPIGFGELFDRVAAGLGTRKDSAGGWRGLGIMAMESGDNARAIEAFSAALELDPADVAARVGKAKAFIAQGLPRAARAELRSAATADESVAEAHLQLGLSYMRMAPPDVNAARAEWAMAVAIAPDSAIGAEAKRQLSSATGGSIR
jgi:hypothetical protein